MAQFFTISKKTHTRLFSFLVTCFISLNVLAQLSGVKTIPGDYFTVAAAVTDLNTQGVGAGGVTINIAAGYTETLTGKITLTATGSLANPIVFQKSGIGANPQLIAYPGIVATPSVLADGFFVLAGSDYVTIDGLDLAENPANTTTTNVMEFGYGLFKASATDGCQYNTIKNCTITLNRLQNTAWTSPGHNGSIGIAVLNGLNTATGLVTVTAASGSNSFNKIYANTIQNCNAGITFIGYAAPSPFALGDTGNDIGGGSLATGNTILNFGGGGATNPATGIFVNNQWGLNLSYNTINNNNGSGVNHTTTMRGIFLNSSSTSASADCNFNNITLHGGATTSDLTFIENVFGSTPAGNTININSNRLTGDYLTATTGAMRGIYHNGSTPAVLNMNNNTITNWTYGTSTLAGSGVVYPIYTGGSNAAMTINANDNIISNISRTGSTGGNTIGIYVSAGVNGMGVNVKRNTIQNLSIDGTGTSSLLYGIQISTGTIVVDSNLIDNLSCLKSTGTGALYGIYNISSPIDENYKYNIIRNLNHVGTGIVYGIYTNTVTGVRTVSNNLIHTLSTGGTTVAAILMTTSSPTIFKNKVYDISSSSTGSPTVSGLIISTLGTAGIANVYNNYIGDLRAPNATSTTASSPSIRGVNITVTSTSTNVNLSFNTVRIDASSSGTDFATTALYVTTSTSATTANLTLQNNIFINTSLPAGIGNAVAYQRSSTSLTNYNSASTSNLFFAGTPGANNLIYFDGTNADQTISGYKARVSPADANSVAENPTFLSLVGSSPNFLHINPTVPTQIESGGVPVAGISDDFDGDVRNVSTPDIGADEGIFIGADLSGPTISYTNIPNSICTNALTLSATITDPSGVHVGAGLKPRLWYKKSTENNVLAATNTAADNGWKYVEAANSSSPFTFNIDYSLLNSPVVGGDNLDYFVVAQDSALSNNFGVNSATFATAPTSVSLMAANFPVSNTKTYRIISTPVTLVTNASTNQLCEIGDVSFTITGDTITGATYQWQKSLTGSNPWVDIAGATALTYAVTGLDSSYFFRCEISCGGTPISASPSAPILVAVNKPSLLATFNDTVCGPGPITATLGATPDINSDVNWYANPTGGAKLFTGTSFTTPAITSSTTYYAAPTSGGGITNVGKTVPVASPTSGAGTTAFGLVFDALSAFTLQSVVVYPIASTANTAGTVTIDVIDANNVILHTATVNVIGNPLAQATAQTVLLNFNIQPGTNLKLRPGARSTGITGLLFDPSAQAPVGGNYGYPFSIPGVVNINHSTLTAAPANTARLDLYYYFYNWQVTTGCEGPRVPVRAVITTSTITDTSVVACGSFTWYKNGQTYTSSGVYANTVNCNSDSLRLTINNPATSIDTKTACGNYTWINGTNYTANNNSATFTIPNGAANGCDSIITLNLTIKAPASGTETKTACGSFTWINGTTYTSSNNSATFTIAGGAANGCDSVVTLNLTINNPTTGIDTKSACNSFSWIDGNTYTANNNTAMFTVAGGAVNGCDSIITLNLTIKQSSASTIADTICNGASYTFGTQTLTQGGTYTRTIPNAAGCDSVITLNLFVRPAVSVAIAKAGNTLTASSGFVSYQWKLNGSNIPSANAQTYTATTNGNYTVAVTDANGCSETSAITNVMGVGINDITEIAVSVYPNPASERLFINCAASIESIEIVDVLGKRAMVIDHATAQIDISTLSSAPYTLVIKTAKGNTTKRFIKE